MINISRLNWLLLVAGMFLLSSFSSASEFDIADYSGKTVYVDFWASWCKPCRQSFPWMNKLLAKYEKDGLVIIAINLDKDAALAEKFLQENPATFKVLLDPTAEIAKKYKISGMPSALLFNTKGELVEQHVGFFPEKTEEYEQNLQKAMQ